MDYMELAFTDDLTGCDMEGVADIQTDLRRAVSQWLYILSNRKTMIGRIDRQFIAHVKSWGYWKQLEGQPLDTVAINLRDIINSYLTRHPVVETAAITDTKSSVLEIYLKPSDNVAEIWHAMLRQSWECKSYKPCKQCNKPFSFQSHRAIYCSDACRTRASRGRNAPA